MAYVKTELISLEWGFKTTFQTYQLCFDIFHGSLSKTELISLEWGFKYIPDLSALFTSSMAYPKQASEWRS